MRIPFAAFVIAFGAASSARAQTRDTVRVDYPASQCRGCPEWIAPHAPFHIFGNTYFVGTNGISSILITSAQGHVLIDASIPAAAPQIAANIRALGFRLEDVKLIVNSHAHFDHAGGIAALATMSGARVAASPWAAKVIGSGDPDIQDPQYGLALPFPGTGRVDVIADNQTLHVGPIAITAHFTPGHTPGGTSWSWDSCEKGVCHHLLYADSQTPVSADDFFFTRSTRYSTGEADFTRGLDALDRTPCDLLLTPHPGASSMFERLAQHDFADPALCKSFVANARAAVAKRMADERAKAGTVPKGEARQVVDTVYAGAIVRTPAYHRGAGPVVTIDAAHHNFHTADGRFRPFARLLGDDGFTVRSGIQRIDAAALKNTRVLVIANAISARDERAPNWHLPTAQAFDSTEVAAIASWVRGGGSLLLIADHMPFPGAVTDLGAAFGVHFANAFALYGTVDPETGDYPIVFRRRDGTLLSNPLTDGRNRAERIDSIETFTGTAFHLSGRMSGGIFALPANTRLMMPVRSWEFSDSTAQMRADGMLQGAAFALGRGRVAVFGEAAMFSAQRKGVKGVPMGFNAPSAHQNVQFILNVMHWLARAY
jgi:metallo-beta-lactamase class B